MKYVKKLKNKISKIPYLPEISLAIATALVLVLVLLYAAFGFDPIKPVEIQEPVLIDCFVSGKQIKATKDTCKELSKKVTQPQPTPKPTPQPTNYVPPSPPQIVDTDPIILCENEKCGDRNVRDSVCETSTCCEISDGNWKWVESQSLCYQMQKDNEEKELEIARQKSDWMVKGMGCRSNAWSAKSDCNDFCFDLYNYEHPDGRESCLDSCEDSLQSSLKLCAVYDT